MSPKKTAAAALRKALTKAENEEKRDRLELALLLFSPSPPVKLIANAARQSLMRKMMENGLMRRPAQRLRFYPFTLAHIL